MCIYGEESEQWRRWQRLHQVSTQESYRHFCVCLIFVGPDSIYTRHYRFDMESSYQNLFH